MINSDGGSTDGTPDLIRGATFTEADRVQTSHPLRTLHRVLAPYHGLPGKHTALRTVFAAAELTQAKALVVIDPGGPATTPGARDRADCADRAIAMSSSSRRGIDAIRATASSSRSSCGRWCARSTPSVSTSRSAPSSAARDALRRTASSRTSGTTNRRGSRSISGCAPKPRPSGSPSVRSGGRPTTPPAAAPRCATSCTRSCVSVVESLRAHESFWLNANAIAELRTWGVDPVVTPDVSAVGLPGPGRAGPSRHRRDHAAARGRARSGAVRRGSWTTSSGTTAATRR